MHLNRRGYRHRPQSQPGRSRLLTNSLVNDEEETCHQFQSGPRSQHGMTGRSGVVKFTGPRNQQDMNGYRNNPVVRGATRSRNEMLSRMRVSRGNNRGQGLNRSHSNDRNKIPDGSNGYRNDSLVRGRIRSRNESHRMRGSRGSARGHQMLNRSTSCDRNDVESETSHHYDDGSRENSRGHRYQPRNSKEPRKFPIGFKPLQDILNKEPDDIILQLLSDKSGYSILLTDDNITSHMLILLFKVLLKACKTICNKENLLDLLSMTFSKSFVNMLIAFIIKIKNLKESCIHEFFSNFINVCSYFQESRPFETIDFIENITNATLLVFQNDDVFDIEVNACKDLMAKVTIFKSSVTERRTEVTKYNGLQYIDTDDLEPPDDFRKIPVLPTSAEISQHERPFLRKNVVAGRYRDANHYLDVQFRLLREDFIRPLRDGISYFQNPNGAKNNRDLKIYRKVKVDRCELCDNEYVYYIKLNFPKHMKVENSKWLLFGNLVCFSIDGFQTLIFGYVFDRKPETFKKGLIGVKFESKPIDFKGTYDMAESRAYFVAYRHVLEALQNIRDDEMPLPHYLLHVSNDLHRPSYWHGNMRYDMRVIKNFKLMNKSYARSALGLFRSNTEEPQIDFHPELSRINVSHHLDFWPNAEILSLDASQRAALYGAITQQLAIIQGPPGTGKTFLGLKITQILLHNKDIWSLSSTKAAPILVVCYTNHALDQFLEGMMQFTNSIVRIGSRSKNESISNLQINNLVALARKNRIMPRSIHERNSNLYREVQSLERNFATLVAILKECKSPKGIFTFDTLNTVIPHEFAPILRQVGMENWLLNTMDDNENWNFVEDGELQFDVADDPVEDTDTLNTASDEEWEDAQEFLEQYEIDRVLDTDVIVERKNFTAQIDYIYDLSCVSIARELSLLNSELDNLQNNLENENFIDPQYQEYVISQNCIELQCMQSILTYKLNFLKIGLNKLKNILPKQLEFKVNNIFELTIPKRWQLYHYWIEQYIQELSERITRASAQWKHKLRALAEVRNQEYLHIMRSSAVVGMTTTGAAKYNQLIKAMSPDIVIIEEAAEILEAHVVTSLTEDCKHLILIGDHQQLRPSTTVYELATKYKLETSLFERMIKNGVRYDTLEFQHRMRPSISKLLVPSIYPALKDASSVEGRDCIEGLTKDIFFIDHEFQEKMESDDNVSHENLHEAKLIMSLCRHLLLQGYSSDKITILTPYSGQFFLLRKIQREHRICAEVKICVVDNFQGEENDIILLTLVRSNPKENVGFLKIDNRVCVALSRAKNGFYIVGNMNQLCSNGELWKKIKQTLIDQEAIGPKLTLQCINHPDIVNHVSCAEDFKKFSPEGGCLKPCSFSFEACGHPCPRTCHAMDMDHEKQRCLQPCLRKLCDIDDHLCLKKCYETCGPCLRPVLKELSCGHQHTMECWQNPSEFPCPTKVERELPDCQHVNEMACHVKIDLHDCSFDCDTRLDCGHKCRLKCHRKNDPNHDTYSCYEKCPLLNKGCSSNHKCQKPCYEECGNCLFLVEKKLPCGHTHNNVKCFEKPEDIVCKKICNKMMSCGHRCPRKCFEPCGGCNEKVEKDVPTCGHKVTMPCGDSPDKKYCKNNCPLTLPCGHKCRAKCKDPCTTKCGEQVPSNFKCPRGHQVRVPCHKRETVEEDEVWLLCQEKCNLKLECGHICKGTCGDCFTGRIHISCNSPCEKTLVCGHICKTPCSMDCPPCQQPCEFKCGHSRCRKPCSVLCVPCRAKCTWSCPHKTCTENCGNICSRDPCTEPCPKTLKCGHPCIGFCGDPCPILCRVCDRETLTEFILCGNEEDEDARFVMLEDCKHVIEVEGLEQWLNVSSDGEIGMKQCPRCKKSIFNSRRYNQIVKNTYKDVERIKRKYFNKNNGNKILTEISELLSGKVLTYYSQERINLLSSVGLNQVRVGKTKRKRYSDMHLNLVFSQAKVLSKASEIQDDVKNKNHTLYGSATQYNKQIHTHLQVLQLIVGKILKLSVRISSQLMNEVICELQRIAVLPAVYRLMSTRLSNSNVTQLCCQIDKLMDPTIKFDTSLEKKVRDALKEAEKFVGGLGISDAERAMIVSAMQLRQGHWYKCPNNHIYCITECGGAMQRANCPECGAVIGGESHDLEPSNTVASEMDGARYAAWSNQANLNNYNLDD